MLFFRLRFAVWGGRLSGKPFQKHLHFPGSLYIAIGFRDCNAFFVGGPGIVHLPKLCQCLCIGLPTGGMFVILLKRFLQVSDRIIQRTLFEGQMVPRV